MTGNLKDDSVSEQNGCLFNNSGEIGVCAGGRSTRTHPNPQSLRRYQNGATRRTLWGLALTGLICEAVYLIAVVRLPWWRYCSTLRCWSNLLGDGLFPFAASLAGIALLAAAYLWGWRLVRRGADGGRTPHLRVAVWGGAVLFALTLFWLLPITSDLFTYLTQAHLFTDLGLSPYEAAPLQAGLEASQDPLLLAYPALYASKPSVYGPAWLLISAPGTLGGNDLIFGLIYLKGLATLAFLGCAWLVERILRQVRPAAAIEGLYLLAWNPLLLFMAAGDGHNDVVMIVLVLLALWLLLRERPGWAFAFLTLSVWVKYVSVLFFPLFIIYLFKVRDRSARRAFPLPSSGPDTATPTSPPQSSAQGAVTPTSPPRFAGGIEGGPLLPILGGLLVALAVTALVIAPFWSPSLITGLADRLLHPVNWQGGGSGLASRALILGLLLFGAAYLFLAWRLARQNASFQRLANACFEIALLAFVLGAARSQPWHLIWPAALAGLSDRRWAWPLVAALSVLMLVVQVWVEWGMPGW